MAAKIVKISFATLRLLRDWIEMAGLRVALTDGSNRDFRRTAFRVSPAGDTLNAVRRKSRLLPSVNATRKPAISIQSRRSRKVAKEILTIFAAIA
jgi:hypothetical protein